MQDFEAANVEQEEPYDPIDAYEDALPHTPPDLSVDHPTLRCEITEMRNNSHTPTPPAPGPRPVHRERSFYDQQAMYSRQMQAMGMGAPFMLGGYGPGGSDQDDDDDQEHDSAVYARFGPAMGSSFPAVQAAPPQNSPEASQMSGLNRGYSSRPATLYNTQGKTNDFGSNASGSANYSLYNF